MADSACYGLSMMNRRASKIGGRTPQHCGRAIHLVDLENLIGTSAMSVEQVAMVRQMYVKAADVAGEDHVVLATGPTAAPTAWFAWGPARRLVRAGIDGADQALLEVIALEALANRYTRVVVGSGDGIFTDACRVLQLSCTVTVVCRRESLSAQLSRAVRDVRFLEDVPSLPPVLSMGEAA